MAKLWTSVVGTDYKWYAVYTRLNHEKAAEAYLSGRGIEVFLPKQSRVREWADRKKLIIEPVFRQYLFVRICNKEYFEVLESPSVLWFVMFEGKACTVPEAQIELLRKVLNNNIDFEVVESRIEPGQKVIISKGPLKGYLGEVVSHKGKRTIQLAVENLNYSILVSLNDRSQSHKVSALQIV